MDSIARLISGDQYIGRGSRQRKLEKSLFSNPYKVSEYGRENTIRLFEQFLDSSSKLISQVHSLSGKRLVCHCGMNQTCHADALIRNFRELHPDAFDRNGVNQRAPTTEELNLLAAHRQEPPGDDGSSADDGVPAKNSGWVGQGCPLQVGIGYTSRTVTDRVWPRRGVGPSSTGGTQNSPPWERVKERFARYTEFRGTPELLMALALDKVEGCPFDAKEIEALKNELVTDLEKHGLDLGRKQGDREDLLIDFRFLGLLLKTAKDPEIGLGDFAQGVRVGPGSGMPRLPALYRPKRRWRLASQTDRRAYLDEEDHSAESAWRKNYATVQPLAKEVFDVLDDQTRRGMFIRLPEQVAKEKYPNLVVASLGANRKDRPNGEVTTRVLHDGTNGLAVDTRTRLRDQERSPFSADLKRALREKDKRGLNTFALTADVKEAHRQIPIHPRDWHLLGCQ